MNRLLRMYWTKKISFPLKYVISGKPLIAPEPEVGKFQNWAEIKVNYPTDKKDTPEDFSDNFCNIKNSYKLTILNSRKAASFFLFSAPEKPPGAGKFSRWAKSITYRCQIIVLKFQEIPTTMRFRIWAQTQTPESFGQTIIIY